jgi:hypothetical protein
MSRETDVAITVELSKAMRWLGADPDQIVPSGWRGDRLYPFFQQLDARSDLLGLVGSYGDELKDEQVLEGLRRWNKLHKSQSRLSATLSFFQRDFLHVMEEAQARFLVIGGQARRHHVGMPTRDLDIWTEDRPAFQHALDRWREKYPQYSEDMQLLSRPWVRVWFPDDTCVSMHGTDDVENGIDIHADRRPQLRPIPGPSGARQGRRNRRFDPRGG